MKHSFCECEHVEHFDNNHVQARTHEYGKVIPVVIREDDTPFGIMHWEVCQWCYDNHKWVDDNSTEET